MSSNPNYEQDEYSVLIVTGSNLRAEHADRPLAYQLQNSIDQLTYELDQPAKSLVISDLWYLNAKSLQNKPMISIGGPGVNAVSAYLYKYLANALVAENALVIQMDPSLKDLRACVWGANHKLTINALDIFVEKGYLRDFLTAVWAQNHK
ncbi:MAG: hypothetical protein JW936_01555 [Sedimentisphaerales bacterium]|nr:hypothetical protein [Sedimentisphaerales bacterium]